MTRRQMRRSVHGSVILRWAAVAALFSVVLSVTAAADHIRQLQATARAAKHASWGHWGPDPTRYSSWNQHTNRLIPVYTFGMTLDGFAGEHSPYRDAEALERLYGRLPEATLNPAAEYFDQTAVYTMQKLAAEQGKKYIVLLVFDGMDWQTTWAAAIHQSGAVPYRQGRGSGLAFQDYRGCETDFGYFVTSPYSTVPKVDVDAQTIVDDREVQYGGYDPRLGGARPWDRPLDAGYLIAKSSERPHAYTDSASSATSLTSGIKTYNDAINVDRDGRQVTPIARTLQQRGWAVGVVTSVPISHATPACAYATNVHRRDYQDLSRDLVGLPSVAHREEPLPGVDVLLGAGWGEASETSAQQGDNFVPGNVYITDDDLRKIDFQHGGRYRVALRKAGQNGAEAVSNAAGAAARHGERLFGMFGYFGGRGGSHLPFQTADGDYRPTAGAMAPAEEYAAEDIDENPTLADLTRAALAVLETNEKGFWLMVEAGDVDWANHDNNIDNSIGAVKSGDEAFRVVTEWVEAHDAWAETVVIVTADHGHYLVLNEPEALIEPASAAAGQ